MTGIPYDPNLVDTVASALDLRTPNRAALDTLARAIDDAEPGELFVADLATGVGKTYVAAGLIDYLAAAGVRNIVIVTPGSTIQRKTINNFTPGHPKHVRGLTTQPEVITLDDLETGRVAGVLDDDSATKVFVFTVQSLLRPNTADARRAHRAHEVLGQALSDHLRDAADLVVIADEHHIYTGNAKRFAAAIADLNPAAVIGLTATPDPSTAADRIVYRYPLAEAIADGFVKIPVLVGRPDTVKDTRTQMADAVALLDAKATALRAWCTATGNTYINPVLFVVAQTIDEANELRNTLAQPDLIGSSEAVLLITSEEPEASLEALDKLEHPDSPVRAVVSVSMLKEGWDVKNIFVIASVRAMESELLTEQVLGRGLRLPYGRRTGIGMLDTVEVLSHHSFEQLLDEADVLLAHTWGQRTADAEAVTAAPPEPAAATGEAPHEAAAAADELGQVEVFLPGPAAANPNHASLFADDPETATSHQVGGIATVAARLAEAAVTTTALEHPDSPKPPSGVRIPWFLPQVRTRLVRRPLPLAAVNLMAVEALGQNFADDNAPTLTRKALDDHRDADGQVTVDIRDATNDAPVAAAQLRMPFASIETDLRDRLVRTNAVAQTVSEYNAAAAIAAAFLTGAGVTEDTPWRSEHARLATSALAEWLAVRQREAPPETVVEVDLTRWPDGEPRVWASPPTNRNKVTSSRNFLRGKPYGGWAKSIYPIEAFDSWSAEFKFAELVEGAPQVKAWARIATDVPLSIAYTLGASSRTYRPDFIILDSSGTYWVAEGKADSEMTDETVIAKRNAATAWVDAVNASDAVSQRWAYLLASETAIANASGWTQLLAASYTHK